MSEIEQNGRSAEVGQSRAIEIYNAMLERIHRNTDHMFAGLMIFQWFAGIVAALVISPRTWEGPYSQTHIHVWAAIILGGAITFVPVVMALQFPGKRITRHVIAVGQMLTSALLIHLTGGRIETHFHVFGSLAFLAFYHDWTVLLTGSTIVAIDHLVRGLLWPQSVYGVLSVEPWRWLEHAGWVAFEDVFLFISISRSLQEKMLSANQQATLETVNARIEREVHIRTAELRESDARAKESEAKLRTIFDASPHFIGILSLIDGRLLDVNDPRHTIGYTRDELLAPQTDQESFFVDPTQRDRFVRQVCAEKLVRNFDLDLRVKDGRVVPFLFSGAIAEVAGKPCVVTIGHDIEELKRAEADLIDAREAALASSRAKSEFLSVMSHEIRTPMNAVLGMADLLADTELGEDQRRYINTMTENGSALLNLINGILDLASIESGRLRLDHSEFDIEELVAHVAQTLSVRAEDKGLELTTQIAHSVPPRLLGDSLRLRQILINLVGNAVKFTEHGEVALRIESRLGAQGTAELRITVRDDGIGIAPDQIDKVFQSFTQVDSSTSRRYEGSGLGLTIAQRLVQLMGGKIWAESELGKGSTFHVIVRMDVAQDAGIARTGRPFLRGIRALVVDDLETNRLIVREALLSQGATVDEASSGPQALALAAQTREKGQPYPLVILDCRMPGMDGFEVAIKMRHDHGDQPPTVLMLSSNDLNRSLDAARRTGIDVYIVKPVRRSELLSAVGKALGTQAADGVRRRQANGALGDTPHLRILLAEDNVDNRKLIEEYLSKGPYTLDKAENGLVALTKFTGGLYDLILMDMQMPVLDGYSAVRKMRTWEREHGRAPTPITALSAAVLQSDVVMAIEAGCTSHLSKPIKRARLIAEIEQLTNEGIHQTGNDDARKCA